MLISPTKKTVQKLFLTNSLKNNSIDTANTENKLNLNKPKLINIPSTTTILSIMTNETHQQDWPSVQEETASRKRSYWSNEEFITIKKHRNLHDNYISDRFQTTANWMSNSTLPSWESETSIKNNNHTQSNWYDWMTSYNWQTNWLFDDAVTNFALHRLETTRILMCNVIQEDLAVYKWSIISNDNDILYGRVFSTQWKYHVKIYAISARGFSPWCIGGLKSNCTRNKFTVYEGVGKNKKNIATIEYEINPFGIFGWRNIIINYTGDKGTCQGEKQQEAEYTLINKRPIWSNKYHKYQLDFNLRVKEKSKKNFLLVEKNNNSDNILWQCGKINDTNYAWDFQTPLSPFWAFGISITSLLPKHWCE